MKLDDVTRNAIAAFFQETTTFIGDKLGVDPVDRIIMLEIVAARLRSNRLQGPTFATVGRGVGLPYNTARRRVQALIDRKLICDTPSGLDACDWEVISSVYDEISEVILKRLEPIVLRLRAEQDRHFGDKVDQNGTASRRQN